MTGKLTDLLRSKRSAKGLSLSQVAKGVPMSKAHLHDLETGRQDNPSIFILLGLSRELEIHPHDLIDACFASVRAALNSRGE